MKKSIVRLVASNVNVDTFGPDCLHAGKMDKKRSIKNASRNATKKKDNRFRAVFPIKGTRLKHNETHTDIPNISCLAPCQISRQSTRKNDA